MLLSDLMALCVCVCVHQNFKGLCQGCVIPFKETEAVKAALPQNLDERGTHSHVKWKGNIYDVRAHSLLHFSNTIHTTSHPWTHSYGSYINSACVFLLNLQPLLTSSRTTCRPLGPAARWPVCELRAASVCELSPAGTVQCDPDWRRQGVNVNVLFCS